MKCELEENLKEHIDFLIKNMVLKSKVKQYYHPHKGEWVEIVLYWDDHKYNWVSKNDAIMGEINKSIRPIIENVLKNNEDFIKYFI